MFIFVIPILNIVQFSVETPNMQTLLVEKLALTFADDAYALTAGACKILLKIATAPFERMARACDVAGVLANRRKATLVRKATIIDFRARKPLPSVSRRKSRHGGLFSFRSLDHLT